VTQLEFRVEPPAVSLPGRCGTYAKYNNKGCRCSLCVAAAREYRNQPLQKERKRAYDSKRMSRPEVKEARREYRREYRRSPGYRERQREAERKHRLRPESKKREREYYRKRAYGLSPVEIKDMWMNQGGACKICRKQIPIDDRNTHVDHDHATGRVRGLLCSSCNTGLGKLGDNEQGLLRAIAYLRGEL